MIFASPATIAYSNNTILPDFLTIFFDPLNKAAMTGEIIDFEALAFNFTLAHFSQLAFDVSVPRSAPLAAVR